MCFPFFDKNLSNFTKRQLVYVSQGKGDNSKNQECGKMGPRPGWVGIFLFFKLTSNHQNILAVCFQIQNIIAFIEMLNWTFPERFNVKYFLDIKNDSGFILPTTWDDL